MTAQKARMQNVSLGAHYAVHLPAPDDFAFWRERARGLIQCDVPPDRVSWVEPVVETGNSGGVIAGFAAFQSAVRKKLVPLLEPPEEVQPPCV